MKTSNQQPAATSNRRSFLKSSLTSPILAGNAAIIAGLINTPGSAGADESTTGSSVEVSQTKNLTGEQSSNWALVKKADFENMALRPLYINIHYAEIFGNTAGTPNYEAGVPADFDSVTPYYEGTVDFATTSTVNGHTAGPDDVYIRAHIPASVTKIITKISKKKKPE